jgi:hypothetical protein
LNSLSALYYHINQNRLPTLRRGGRYLFDRRELDAWLRGTSALELVRKRPDFHFIGCLYAIRISARALSPQGERSNRLD